MSSRSGPGPNRHRSRETGDDFPPLPAPRLPSLRTLSNLQQERETERARQRGNADRERSEQASRGHTGASFSGRPPTRNWSSAAARRGERIRSLDDLLSNPSSWDSSWNTHRYTDPTWVPSLAGPFDARRTTVPPAASNSNTFSNLDRSLGEANSHLRTLLDLTNLPSSTVIPPAYSPPPRPHDSPGNNRRSKRRKVESDKVYTDTKSIRYGRYGQVEPGQLRMEIVSCDGGMFSNESLYAAENILKNDFSVYCTKGNRCNIVLRHQGGTPFTLQELVIKAPGSMNYSHPVSQGMVFVSMKQDDMLNRTAQYQIQYGPQSDEASMWHAEGDGGNGSHFDGDPRRIISIRHHEDGSMSTRARSSFSYRNMIGDDDGDDEELGNHFAHMPPEFARNVPGYVTTECSDVDEDGDQADDNGNGNGGNYHTSSRFQGRTPNRIGSLPFETNDYDSDGQRQPFGGQNTGGSEDLVDDLQLYDHQREHHYIHNNSNYSFANHDFSGRRRLIRRAHPRLKQDPARAVGGTSGLLSPHARFFIEEKKSKCTIHFDPPVSGRFILLKMWSSSSSSSSSNARHDASDSNIDIQSVIARGFAGPRYFPAVQLT